MSGPAQPGQQGQRERGDQILRREHEMQEPVIDGSQSSGHEMGLRPRRPGGHAEGARETDQPRDHEMALHMNETPATATTPPATRSSRCPQGLA